MGPISEDNYSCVLKIMEYWICIRRMTDFRLDNRNWRFVGRKSFPWHIWHIWIIWLNKAIRERRNSVLLKNRFTKLLGSAGDHTTQNKLFWIRSVAGSLVVEMHVPDVTLRVNKPNWLRGWHYGKGNKPFVVVSALQSVWFKTDF